MSAEFLEKRIVALSLARWRYGALMGEWDAEQAEIFRAAGDAISEKLHDEISALAKLRGLTHIQFAKASHEELKTNVQP